MPSDEVGASVGQSIVISRLGRHEEITGVGEAPPRGIGQSTMELMHGQIPIFNVVPWF